MRLVKRAAPAAAALVLLPAAAAQAATVTVDPAGAGPKTITEGVAAAQTGDTIMVKAGAYAEDVTLPAAKDDLTLTGETGTALTGSLVVDGDNVKVNRVAITRTQGTDGAIDANAPGFVLTDSTLINATGSGIDVAGDATIQRSVLITGAADGDGVDMVTGAGTHALKVDSSVIIGGVQGAGIAVRTSGGSAGAVTVDIRHVTIPAVSSLAVLLDNSASGGVLTGGGAITANVTGSILHSTTGSLLRNSTGLGLAGLGRTALTATFRNNDTLAIKKLSKPAIGPDVEDDPMYGPTLDADQSTPNGDAALFGKTFQLKVGSPGIDKGGPIVGDESTTDINGDPRQNGGSTDVGADEFTNVAPVAKAFTVEPASPQARQAAKFVFDASDANEGDALAWVVDWGDGTPKQTANVGTIDKLYARPGTYTVQYAVVDSFGTPSNLVSQQVVVRAADGSTPTTPDTPGTTPTTPGGGGGALPTARIRTKKLLAKRFELRIRGVAAAPDGIAKVEVAITRNAGCRQFTGRGFGKRSKACGKKLKWLEAERYGGNKFEYITDPDVKLPKGKYVLRARTTDADGTVGKASKGRRGSLVKLRVK